ncbi:hypothetical protein YC2023_044957 [Brassica napus]
MYRKKYDWSKHVWGYQETEQPYAESSEDDGSKEEEAGERSDCGMEEEIETAHVSPAKKRKNQYQDIGAESRKKRLLCQRSTDKYRDLEESMKSYIQGMFNSSFTALGLEVRDLIEDRLQLVFRLILSLMVLLRLIFRLMVMLRLILRLMVLLRLILILLLLLRHLLILMLLLRHLLKLLLLLRRLLTLVVLLLLPALELLATKLRFLLTLVVLQLLLRQGLRQSLFETLDVNLGTQEDLEKTMGNLTQESHVKGFHPSQDFFNRPFLNDIDDPEVRCKDSDYELVFVPEDKFSKLTEWILKPK